MPRLQHQKLSVHHRTARGLVQELADGELSVETPYQRQSVWTTAQRVAKIESWLRGIPLPAIILNSRVSRPWIETSGHPGLDEPATVAIDGRQRLETAQAWFDGRLAVPRAWWDDDELRDSTVKTVTYHDLTRVTQRDLAMNTMLFPVAEAGVATVAEEAAVYLLVNTAGTSQTPADLERASRVAGGLGTHGDRAAEKAVEA